MGALGPHESVAEELSDDGERDEALRSSPSADDAAGDEHPVEVQEVLDVSADPSRTATAENPSEQPPLPDFNP